MRYIVLFIVSGLVIILGVSTFSYFNFDPSYGFLRLKQEAIKTGWYLPAYYAHVLLGGIILMVGFVQLFPITRKFKTLHRSLGKFYVLGILFFSAPGGLIMSFFIDRGWGVTLSFLIQVLLWMYCTYQAYASIKQHNVYAHECWMWRSYALTFAAVTLRVYVFISSYWISLSHPAAYLIIAWLSWTINIIAVEIWLRSRSIKSILIKRL